MTLRCKVVGVGFIIGVIQDSVETALNSAGDVEFAATAEYHQWLKEGKPCRISWRKADVKSYSPGSSAGPGLLLSIAEKRERQRRRTMLVIPK